MKLISKTKIFKITVRVLRSQVNVIVNKVVPAEVMRELLAFVVREEPHLWGEDRPDNFVKTSLVLTLYKWITNLGYGVISRSIKGWFRTSHVSLRHNGRVLSNCLGKWGRSKIKLGSYSDRLEAATCFKLKAPLEGVTLLMDCSDFRIFN